MGDDPLAAVRVAFAHHDWQRAFDAAASAVTPIELEATRVDLMAEAAWWLGRLDECITARERAYSLYDERGDDRGAGQCAVWLYEHYLMRVLAHRSPRPGCVAPVVPSRSIRTASNTERCCCVRRRLRTAAATSTEQWLSPPT